MSDRALWNVKYYEKVLSLRPIAYWMMNERNGTVAWDQATLHGAAAVRHGIYQGVDLGQPGIGDGETCPYFDGANDFNNVYTASLDTAFPGSEGSIHLWIKILNVAEWTDGVERRFVIFTTNGASILMFRRVVANNSINWYYNAGGVAKQVTDNTLVSVGWLPIGLTWSATADEVRAYLNGVQNGVTQTVLGVWAGALINNQSCIGAGTTVPTYQWLGNIAHAALFPRALTPTEMKMLGTV